MKHRQRKIEDTLISTTNNALREKMESEWSTIEDHINSATQNIQERELSQNDIS